MVFPIGIPCWYVQLCQKPTMYPWPRGRPRRRPWQRKALQSCPGAAQRDPKWARGAKKEIEKLSKESNQSQNCNHINQIYQDSRSTAIQWPASTI